MCPTIDPEMSSLAECDDPSIGRAKIKTVQHNHLNHHCHVKLTLRNHRNVEPN